MLNQINETLAPYSKLIAALIGVTLFVVFKKMDIEIPGFDNTVGDLIAGALLVGGAVYQAPANKAK